MEYKFKRNDKRRWKNIACLFKDDNPASLPWCVTWFFVYFTNFIFCMDVYGKFFPSATAFWNSLHFGILCKYFPLAYGLNPLRHLKPVNQLSLMCFSHGYLSFSFNSIPCCGFATLHGVNVSECTRSLYWCCW